MQDIGSFQKGILGESVAEGFLKLKGHEIVEKRYKTPYGEIDIISRYKNMIVCTEVKVRKTIGDGLHVVSSSQKRRVMDAYLHFIQHNPCFDNLISRFDVVVCAPGAAPLHLENAFGE